MSATLNPIKRHHERCREVRSLMSDYLDADLDPTAEATVARHARWCPNCRHMLANLGRTLAGLRALGDRPPADA
jgi:predicted anti-sigma-YlaC factor YlaD